jgi:preprotein translocase SecE subunit
VVAKTVKKIKLDSKKAGKKTTVVESAKTSKPARKKSALNKYNPFTAFAKYVRGSWNELRQVRWPDRRATWEMTLAVIGFTLFFAVIILLLDSLFQTLFKDLLLK